MRKYVQTVLGHISPDEMGVTLPHEHLVWDLSFVLSPDLDLNNPDDYRMAEVLIVDNPKELFSVISD